MSIIKRLIYAGLMSVLTANAAFSMIMKVTSIGPDTLGINGKFTQGKAKIINKQRIASTKHGHYLFESLSSLVIKGRPVLVYVTGTGLKNTKTTNGYMEIFDKKSGKLLEQATYVHLADHPHKKTISLKGSH